MYKAVNKQVLDKTGNVIGFEPTDTGAAAVVATIPALFAIASEIRKSKASSSNREINLRGDLEWAYSELAPICAQWKIKTTGIYNAIGDLIFKFSSNAKKFAALLRLSLSYLKKASAQQQAKTA